MAADTIVGNEQLDGRVFRTADRSWRLQPVPALGGVRDDDFVVLRLVAGGIQRRYGDFVSGQSQRAYPQGTRRLHQPLEVGQQLEVDRSSHAGPARPEQS